MDLKIWLRYQLSGSVYIAWFLIFYYSSNSYDLADVASKIFALDVLKIFAAGIPIGAIIHQFSVSLKNQVLGGWFGLRFFQDSMYDDSILTNAIINSMMSNSVMQRGGERPWKKRLKVFDLKCSQNEANANCNGQINAEIIDSKITATHEKLSALNTFYYMRVDNGCLAPALAFMSYLLVAASSYGDLPIFTFSVIMLLIVLILTVRCLGGLFRLVNDSTVHQNDKFADYAAIFIVWLVICICILVSPLAITLLMLYFLLYKNYILYFYFNFGILITLIVFKECVFIQRFSIRSYLMLFIPWLLFSMVFIMSPFKYELNYSRYLNHANKIHVVQINEQHTYESMNNKVVLLSDNGNPLSYESKEIYEYDSSESIVNIMGKNMVDISSLQPQQTDVSSVTYLSNGKKYEVTKVNGDLLPCVIAFCLVYMIALLSYIPIIYFERRDTWNHYVKS